MTPTCQHCQAPIPAGSPDGICPACLIRLGQTDAMANAGNFAPPAVSELQGRIPGIEFTSLIGRGGMGAVYLAHQHDLDRNVAVKILPQSLSRDPAFAQRFRREARALAKLDHENIVRVFGSGVSDGLCYIVMEYIEGTTLREAIDAGAVDSESAMKIIPQICSALSYAHGQGVVHRDIKPENILLGTGGRVKVADFGLAKISESDRAETMLTATGARLGTLRYMAPEQLDGTDVDHRADVYSLGVVFYELLTGQVPMGKFAPPSEKNMLDPRIDDVVMRTLSREPADRYQHIEDLESELQSLSDAEPYDGSAPWAPAEIHHRRRMGGIRTGREWKSNAKLFGWPVLHVAYGHHPRTGQKLVAKGLIAIGDVAIGGIALGGVSLGIVSVGGVAVGINALGGVAIALQMACGGVALALGIATGGGAVGAIAFGGGAVGLFAYGGGAAGYIVGGGGAAGKYHISQSPMTEWIIDPAMPLLVTIATTLLTIGPIALVLALVAIAIVRARQKGVAERKMPRDLRGHVAGSCVTVATLMLFLFPVQAYTQSKMIQQLTLHAVKAREAEQEAAARVEPRAVDDLELEQQP